MRTLARQGRVFWSIVYLLASWIAFAVIFAVVYLPALSPRTGVFGFSLYPYSGESETEQIKKNSLVIVKQTNYKDLEADDVFTFIDAESGAYVTRVFSSYYEGSGGKLTVYTRDIETGDAYTDEIHLRDVIGTYVFAVPYLGVSTAFLTQNKIFVWGGIVVLLVILVIPPIFAIRRSVRKFRNISRFPDGLDTSKFDTHELYIYNDILSFFLEGGLNIVKGYNCDKILIGDNIYFANIAYINKCIYVNINKNLRRYDKSVDRSGAIPILTPYDLDEAKDRIMAFYKAYFKPLRESEKKSK